MSNILLPDIANDQLDIKKYKFIKKLTFLISGGMFLDGFVLGTIGMVMPAITQDLGLSLTWQGLIGAGALIGIFFGSLLGGWLADRIGRRPIFTLDLMLFFIGSVAQFFVTDPVSLFLVRLLMGVAIGMEYSVGWTMLAEFSPARIRGKLLIIQEGGWFIGYMVSYVMGYFLIMNHTLHWNAIMGLSIIPTIILLFMRYGTPESPRWLMSKGRTLEATKIANAYMEKEEQLDVLKQKPTAQNQTYGFSELFSSKNVKATVFMSIFFLCAITPYFAIGSFVPTVLEKLGLENGFAGGLFLNVFAVVGVAFAAVFIDKLGRRKLSIPSFYISAVVFVLIGLFGSVSSSIVLVCFLIFYFLTTIPQAITGVYPGEIFPTEVRAIGAGFVAAVARIGAAMGTFLMPIGIDSYGVNAMVYIAALICLIGGLVTYFMAPETKGRALSETAR